LKIFNFLNVLVTYEQLADHQTIAVNKEALLKEEISQKEDMIIQIQKSHETNLIESVRAKEARNIVVNSLMM